MEHRQHRKRRAAFTLPEVLIGLSIGLIITLTLGSMLVQFSRGSSTLYGYTSISASDRLGLELLARDIRCADAFTNLNGTNISLSVTGQVVRLTFDPNARRLYRITPQTNQVLFANCHELNFSFFQKNPATFNSYTMTTSANCRVVQLRWTSGIENNGVKPVLITHSAQFLNRRP